MKTKSELRSAQPPGYLAETATFTTCLLFLKFYSLNAFAATTFFTILSPFMLHQVLSMLGAILNFVTSLHIDTDTEDFQIFSSL